VPAAGRLTAERENPRFEQRDHPKFRDLFPVVRRNCSVTCDGNVPQRPLWRRTYPDLRLPSRQRCIERPRPLTGRADRMVICMSEPCPFGVVLTGQKALLDDVERRLTVSRSSRRHACPETQGRTSSLS